MFDIILILATILCNCLYIHGLKAAMNDGMILDFIPRKLNNLPEWLKMPLFECPICMSSFHSYILPLVILAFGFSWTLLWVLPFYIVMLAGLNALILSFQK